MQSVLKLLEKNYRIVCAASDPPRAVPDDFSIKDVIDSVLVGNGFAEKRAKQLDVDDFLQCVGLGRWLRLTVADMCC